MNLNKKFNFISKVSELDKILFAKHMAVMAKSGVGLSESVETLIHQTKSPYFAMILKNVLNDLENGQSLSKSLAKYSQIFSPFYTNLIEIGEQSGNLAQNLDYLAKQLDKNQAFKNKIKNATIYPTIVVVLSLILAAAVSIFALPKLIDMFKSLEIQLPLNTRILIYISTVMRDYGLLIVGTLVVLFLIFRIIVQFEPIKLVWHKILLRLPLIGSIIKNGQLALLFRDLGIMIKGGIPIAMALEVQYANTDNLVYKNYIFKIRSAISEGKSIFSQFSLIEGNDIPVIVSKMVGVGERSGNLDESFTYLGDFFEDEVDEAARNITAFLEPVLLFVITAIVAFVALSIISPIYQLTSGIHP